MSRLDHEESRTVLRRSAVSASLVFITLAGWLVLWGGSGSVLVSTAIVLAAALMTTSTALVVRSMGLTSAHPALRWLWGRGWRSPKAVFDLALADLPAVLVHAPGGRFHAVPVLRLDLAPQTANELDEQIPMDLQRALLADAYRHHADIREAAFTDDRPVAVLLGTDEALGAGCWAWRPVPAGRTAPVPRSIVRTGAPRAVSFDVDAGPTARYINAPADPEPPTTREAPVPSIAFETLGERVTTRVSPATAGRGSTCELRLPVSETVSRTHAELTFRADARWWLDPRGRNGVRLNGRRVDQAAPLSHGDRVTWGMSSAAPVSTVCLGGIGDGIDAER